jgi:hypothetical protein
MTNTHANAIETTRPNHLRKLAVAGVAALILVAAACGPGTSDEAASEPQFIAGAANSELRSTFDGLGQTPAVSPEAPVVSLSPAAEMRATLPQTAAGLEALERFMANQEFDAGHETERFEQLKTETQLEDVAAEVESIRR